MEENSKEVIKIIGDSLSWGTIIGIKAGIGMYFLTDIINIAIAQKSFGIMMIVTIIIMMFKLHKKKEDLEIRFIHERKLLNRGIR